MILYMPGTITDIVTSDNSTPPLDLMTLQHYILAKKNIHWELSTYTYTHSLWADGHFFAQLFLRRAPVTKWKKRRKNLISLVFQIASDSFCTGNNSSNEITRALSDIFALDDCLEIDYKMGLQNANWVSHEISPNVTDTNTRTHTS
jgi:hypothetical protein